MYHLHVDQTRNVAILEVHHHAHVYQLISEIHQTVDRNVQLIQNVLAIKHVLDRNVWILVLDHVELVLSVVLLIILRFVFALKDSLEIHLIIAILNHLNVSFFYSLTS